MHFENTKHQRNALQNERAYRISYENNGISVLAKVDSYMNESMIDRLTGLLGRHQEVLEQASEASRGPTAR
jgi:hypothetical protein